MAPRHDGIDVTNHQVKARKALLLAASILFVFMHPKGNNRNLPACAKQTHWFVNTA